MNLYTKKQKQFLAEKLFSQNFLFKVIILVLLLVVFNIFSSQIRNFFYTTSSPLSSILLNSGENISSVSSIFLNPNNLDEENKKLRKENEDLLSTVSFLRDKVKQEYDLKIAEENIKDSKFKVVSVKIIGLDPINDTVIIDRGKDFGILENMPIISKEKVLFGKVSKVYDNFSQITLISSINSAVNAKVQSDDIAREAIFGVLKGEGNNSVYLDLVNFELDLKEGDTLVSSGLDGVFPKNLLIGSILSVNKSDLKPFQTAEVKTFLRAQDTENLFIITNYNH